MHSVDQYSNKFESNLKIGVYTMYNDEIQEDISDKAISNVIRGRILASRQVWHNDADAKARDGNRWTPVRLPARHFSHRMTDRY